MTALTANLPAAKLLVVRALSCLFMLAACGSSRTPATPDAAPDGGDAYVMPPGYDEWAQVCAKHYGDRISEHLCAGGGPPPIRSIAELEQLLDISPQTASLAMTGESSALGRRYVTPINPRAIMMRTSISADQRFEVLAFARGEPLVELVGDDPAAQTLRFFVVQIHLACEATPAGCTPADLMTPTIESSWTSYTLYDEDALANTPLDCHTCHQPDGPGSPKILRMQERPQPWTHWLPDTHGVFKATHAKEATYAGYPIDAMSSGNALQGFLGYEGFFDEPNEFDGIVIGDELAASGTSATWQRLYDNAVTGQTPMPPPYYGPDQTDLQRLLDYSNAYLAVEAGTLPRDQLPKPETTFLNSALPWMSIRPKPGLDGRGILVHMCSQCHNSRLDQTLTRARFNVMTLDAMSRQEKDLAIMRLQLSDDDPLKMPPPRFRTLSDDERALVIGELSH